MFQIHDIEESGAEWQELQEAIQENNQRNAASSEQNAKREEIKAYREKRRVELREKRIKAAHDLYLKFKNETNQKKLDL